LKSKNQSQKGQSEHVISGFGVNRVGEASASLLFIFAF
jgi:hypothetical protein